MKSWNAFAICLALGIGIWWIPQPEGVSPQAWHLLAIFVATIFGIILKPFPMGVVALLGLLAAQLTGTLTFAQGFSGFSSDVVWLVVLAFFIARGIISTGLGMRVAYVFMRLFGRHTLGLGYGLALTELLIAPAVPSVTARAGGIIYPILRSLAQALGSDPAKNTSGLVGAFLTQNAFQTTCITSAMFLTAMAGNPLAAEMAAASGVTITWGGWALAALVPGFLALIIVPYVIYKLTRPEMKHTPHAPALAKQKLQEMGPIGRAEWIMIGTFALLLFLWIFGGAWGIKPAITALIGLVILMLTNVLPWKEVLKEEGAWDILMWFSVLVVMANFLNQFGLISWFSQLIVTYVGGLNWMVAFGVLSLIYFYSHYFFASNVAHIGAMYPAFLIVAVAIGAPPMIAALVLGFFSSLFGGITHYGCGPAPILFGAGYVSVASWWKVGFITSVINLIIWLGVGGIWWKLLGMW